MEGKGSSEVKLGDPNRYDNGIAGLQLKDGVDGFCRPLEESVLILA